MSATTTVRTLADFKRFLAQPGATLQIIQNDWMDPAKTEYPLQGKPGYFDPKQVQRLQSTSVQFTNGGWLQFPKASTVRFHGDQVIVCLDQNGTFHNVLVYRLSLAGEAVAS